MQIPINKKTEKSFTLQELTKSSCNKCLGRGFLKMLAHEESLGLKGVICNCVVKRATRIEEELKDVQVIIDKKSLEVIQEDLKKVREDMQNEGKFK